MSAHSEPLVSVVTPVYNVEAECIESVLAQAITIGNISL
jgi:glycosyltransferase involved in cell wall biosynthesis